MQTYLSIDLDFWNQGRKSFPHMRKFLRQAKDSVSSKNLLIVDSHEELLPHVNESGCDNLINVDWHSDISNRFDPTRREKAWKDLNCGTWVTFVKFRRTGMFTWIHPYKATERSARGYCHYPHTPKHNPFVNPTLGGWNALQERKHRHPEALIDWWSVHAVGICFSYDWVRYTLKDELYQIAEEVLGFRPKPNPHALLG